MNIQFILNKIKLEQEIYSDAELAKVFKVSPAAVSNWKSRKRMPLSIIQQYCKTYKTSVADYIDNKSEESGFLKVYNKKIELKNKNIKLKDNQTESGMDSQYIIDLQKDKIEQQEKELVMLKNILEQQPLQKMKFDDVQADMQTTVEMKNIFSLKPMERKIYNVEGVEMLAKKLNISTDIIKNQYFSENNWHVTDKHPVDKIIDTKSLKDLKRMTRNLPAVLDSLKWVAGLHYMVIPVKYLVNENYCNTICYILLDWKSKPVKVLSKSVIINGDIN